MIIMGEKQSVEVDSRRRLLPDEKDKTFFDDCALCWIDMF